MFEKSLVIPEEFAWTGLDREAMGMWSKLIDFCIIKYSKVTISLLICNFDNKFRYMF